MTSYTEEVMVALKRVAETIYRIGRERNVIWRNPIPDLGERVGFSIAYMRKVRIAITHSVSNRDSYFRYEQGLHKSGLYTSWESYRDSYELPTSPNPNDLLIIICTEGEKNRLNEHGAERFRGKNIIIHTSATFTSSVVNAEIRNWIATWIR